MSGLIYRTELSSGARLVVDLVPGAEVAAIYLWFDVGAAAEGPEEHGAAHFVEHMVFKGTPTRGVGVVAAEIEGLGGDLNAYTSHDQTVLHATVTRDHWETALEVLADMAFCSTFDPDEVELEREVILDEIRGGEDEPDRVLGELVAARAWKTHPYGRPVIGSWSSVRGLSATDLRAFWRRWYQPSRAVLVISGDVEPARAAAVAERWLGGAPVPEPERPARDEAPQSRLRTCSLDGAFDEPLVQLQFQGLALDHADAPVLEVLAELLGGGTSSLLYGSLKLRKKLVTDTWAVVAWELDGGTLTVGCVPHGEHVADAVRALAEGLSACARGDFGLEAVRRARTGLVAARLFERETVDGRAHLVAWHEAFHGDPAAALRYETALAAVDAQDVRRVAAQVLDRRRCVAGMLSPEGGPGRRELRGLLKGLPQPPRRPRRAVVRPPEVHRRLLDNGLTLLVDPVPASPVAALRIVGLGGQLLERSRTAGRAAAWSRCLLAGAGDLDASAVSEEIESRGGSLGAFAGRNTQGLRADFPVDRFEDGLVIVRQVLMEPTFAGEELARVIAELDEDERLLPDRPEDLGWRAIWKALHGPHPYGLPSEGSLASRHRLTGRMLRQLHQRVFRASNLVIAVSGGVDPVATLDRLARVFGTIAAGPSPLEARPDSAWPRSPRTLTLTTDRTQAHALWAWPGLRLLDPRRSALELGMSVLGGQGGRLFSEIREKRGLAYHVSAGSLEGWDPGAVHASLGTDPERLDEGIRAVEAEISRLAAEGPTAEELERVRALALGGLAMDRQRASGRASELAFWERYGVPAAQVRSWHEQTVVQVTAADIQAVLAATVGSCPGVRVDTRTTG